MSRRRLNVLAVSLFFLLMPSGIWPFVGGQKTENPSQPSEMLVVHDGLLAIDTPKGWVRTEGPGLAFFLMKGVSKSTADVWIYISEFDLESGRSGATLRDFVRSDIEDFKKRSKNGSAAEESPFDLPKVKARAEVVDFRSGEQHNGFEQVIYILESDRVLTLVLSAKTEQALSKSLTTFQQFAKSYGGLIAVSPKDH